MKKKGRRVGIGAKIERKWNKTKRSKTELIVLVAALLLLVFGIVPVSVAIVVEVIYEDAVNPFGHSAIRIGDKVYEVIKDEVGKAHIGERNWDDVRQPRAEISLTDEQIQNLLGNIEVGSEFDYNYVTNNCADWVEDQLRGVGVDIPDEIVTTPAGTLKQAKDLPEFVPRLPPPPPPKEKWVIGEECWWEPFNYWAEEEILICELTCWEEQIQMCEESCCEVTGECELECWGEVVEVCDLECWWETVLEQH